MSGVRQVGYFDCGGGGQVVVSGTTAYVAHMKAPDGTTTIRSVSATGSTSRTGTAAS